MRAIVDRITRRDALARLAAGGAAMAWATRSRGDDKQRPPGRIYVATIGRQGEYRPEVSGIMAIDPRDGTWTQVAPEPFTTPRVSPDGRRVLCYRGRPLEQEGIYVVDAGGGEEPRRVVPGRAGFHGWSPDGAEIIFNQVRDGGTLKTWRMKPDGTGRAEVPIPENDGVLDWSRDGRWLLTSSRRGLKAGEPARFGVQSVYLVHPDGTGERRLLEPGFQRTYFRFAPDGRSIVFTQVEADGGDFLHGRYKIEVLGVDGEDRRTLLDVKADDVPFMAVWSPDGTELAVLFRELHLEKGEAPRHDSYSTRLEILGVDGKRRRRLDVLAGVRFLLCDWG